MIVGVLHQI